MLEAGSAEYRHVGLKLAGPNSLPSNSVVTCSGSTRLDRSASIHLETWIKFEGQDKSARETLR